MADRTNIYPRSLAKLTKQQRALNAKRGTANPAVFQKVKGINVSKPT
jgi:hypothetical protein